MASEEKTVVAVSPAKRRALERAEVQRDFLRRWCELGEQGVAAFQRAAQGLQVCIFGGFVNLVE